MSNITINSLPTANTIDPVQDILPIYTASATATQGINRNTFLGLGSAPAGLTDTQTLTNKTLTSPTISSPVLSGTITGTYTIGGTPTFPSSVVTLTGTQTLTNKTLTSPTINSPSITNATISADTVTGYTVSTSGTIYGIPITTSTIPGTSIASATITSTQIATNGIAASNLATTAITLGYAQITSNFNLTSAQTTPTQVTGLTSTVTIPAGGRKVKISFTCVGLLTLASGVGLVTIWDGTVNSGTQLMQLNNAAANNMITGFVVVTPGAGSKTYNIGLANSGTNNTSIGAAATYPAQILVEAI